MVPSTIAQLFCCGLGAWTWFHLWTHDPMVSMAVVWDGYWMVSLTPIIPSSTLWIYFLFFILHLSMFLLLQGLKFHFWLLIENCLPFILASVAGYSLHLGMALRMAWKRFLHDVCQRVLTISTICKLQYLIRLINRPQTKHLDRSYMYFCRSMNKQAYDVA